MSVNDEHELPWLVAEKQFLRDAMDEGVAILGICWGAQLIANACGAAVYPMGSEKLVGFGKWNLGANGGVCLSEGTQSVSLARRNF